MGVKRLSEVTQNKIKIVEKAGLKLQDLLHKADPWQGMDCQRAGCLLCLTKLATGRQLGQDCHKRNVVYETSCLTCARKQDEEIEEMHRGDEEKIREMKKRTMRYLYVGETARSTYERAFEHLSDMRQLKIKSHMLRHMVEMHEGEKREDVQFGVRILRQAKTAFERQIMESVLIQEMRGHHLMNLKSEYNRCAIPGQQR